MAPYGSSSLSQGSISLRIKLQIDLKRCYLDPYYRQNLHHGSVTAHCI